MKNETAAIRAALSGVILAGGQATRMGGQDKGLLMLNGKPLVAHVLQRLRPQVSDIFINANRNLPAYRELGVPVITDLLTGFPGPLAGMVSALRVCKTPYLLTCPCDSPFVPADLGARLYQRLQSAQANIAVAQSASGLEPVFALLHADLLHSLQDYLNAGERKIDRWYQQQQMVAVDFSGQPEAFINLNTPEDLQAAEQKLPASGS